MATRSDPPVWKRVALSWLSLKPWVRGWLVLLNLLFLGALFWLDRPVARVTLAAWLGAGLVLTPILLWQRGLTRLLALGHLLPWTPLLIYLGLRLSGSRAGPPITWTQEPVLFVWAVALTAAVAACLAFDAWDLARWLRGERFVMGSSEAVRAGASRPARLPQESRRCPPRS